MTVRLRTFLAGLSPRSMAVLLSAGLIALHSILLAGSLLRWSAARRLRNQVENINANMAELNEAEREELETLEANLAEAQAEVAQLEGELPDPSALYPLYARAQMLAREEGVVLLNIERASAERTTTMAGEIDSLLYSLQADADLETCLGYIARLEANGGAELSVQNTDFQTDSGMCRFEVLTVSLTGLSLDE